VALGVPHDILWWSAEHGWHAPAIVFDHDVDAECGLGFNIFHRTLSGNSIRLPEPSLPPWDADNGEFQVAEVRKPVVERTSVTVSAAPAAQDAISIRVPWAPDLEERRYYNCHNHISEVQARVRDGSLQPGSFELRPVECRGVSEPLWPDEYPYLWLWAEGLRLRLPPRVEGVWTISAYSELPPGQQVLTMPPSCFWMVAFDNAGAVIDSVRPGLYVDQQPYYYGPTPVLDPTNFLCDELEDALVP
jgi:hypothetical protein